MDKDDQIYRLNSIIETAIDGIVTIDKKGKILTVNRAMTLLFGYAREELIGQGVEMLMFDNEAKAHQGYIDRFLHTRIPRVIGIGREVCGRRKDGSPIDFRLAVTDLMLDGENVFVGFIHDLRDVKRAEQKILELNHNLEQKVLERTNELEAVVNQLLRTNTALEDRKAQLAEALQRERELNELKSRFVSMASHEFRTPLSTILSSASLIKKYDDADQQINRERHIEKIKSSVEQLTGILNDFLTLSKIEEGKLDLEIHNIDLIDLAVNIIEDISAAVKEGQKVEIFSPPSLSIQSDRKLLTGILFNLLSNASKYSDKGQTIELILEEEGDEIGIKVIDQGIGIPEDEQKHIFTRFFRANNVENIQGTGLGLNIVKNYVLRLGGKIDFESRPSDKTTFEIKLPRTWQKRY